MKRPLVLAVAGVVLSAGTYAGTRLFREGSPPIQASTPADAPKTRAYASEQEWLTSEIAGAIWNMSAYAHGSFAPAPRLKVTEIPQSPSSRLLAVYSLEAGAGPQTVEIADYFWSPAPFVSFARTLMPAGARDTSADAVDASLLDALTTPRAEVIQRQNVRLSALLRDHPRSPPLHERAALLLGALALRESAATMSDPRLTMCRMTAHLAIARALDPDGTRIEGRLAQAVLLALVNRQTDALAALDGLPPDAPAAVKAWQRALRIRVTSDWRLDAAPEQSSLLEQRETVRAARHVLDTNGAERMLDRLQEDPRDPDWGRLLFHELPTVGIGNRFADRVIPDELGEAGLVRATFPAPPLADDRAALVRELNVEPSSGPAIPGGATQFWIIDWGTWAASAQRHLIAGIVCRNRHYWYMLGLPEEGARLDADARREFSTLRLFPLAEPYMAKNAKARDAYIKAVAGAATLARARPDLVTDGVLTDLQEQPFGNFVPDVPANIRFFHPYLPVGTAYEVHRVYRTQFRFRLDSPELERLRGIAPYERAFFQGLLERRYGRMPPLDAIREGCAAIVAYDLGCAWMIARAAYRTPDVYVPTLTDIARTLNPDDYHYLGEYLAELHRDDEAERAFERYVEVAGDPVAMSGRVWWLILRYFETGRREKALALGAHAADVYSGAGLIAYANVLDLSGDPTQAERLYREDASRYDDPAPLVAFLRRHPERDTKHEGDAMFAKLFPGGFRQVTAAPEAAPAKGVLITFAGYGGEQNGLKDDDVITAIDGIRVEDTRQYNVVKYRVWTPPMRFLLWRGGRYVSVDTQLRHRWIENRIANYPNYPVWR